MVTIKTCRICLTEKTVSDFTNRRPGKLRNECKACHAIASKWAYEKRKTRAKSLSDSKNCISCKAIKPAREFRKHPSTVDGLSNKCKECESIYYQSPTMRKYLEEKKKSGRQAEILRKYRTTHAMEISQKRKVRRKIFHQEMLASEKRGRHDMRQKALDALGGKCKVCSETRIQFLSVDHVHNDGSIEREDVSFQTLAAMIASGKADLSRYQVLCFNHNIEKQRLLTISELRDDHPEDGQRRRCFHCLLEKSIGLFTRDAYKKSGRKSICKHCSSFQRAIKKNRVIASLGGRCACCGDMELWHLEVDHIDGNGTNKRSSGEDIQIYDKIWIGSRSTEDLQALCANCNMAKAHNKNVCPHLFEVAEP